MLLGRADGDEPDLAVAEVAMLGELRPRQFGPSTRRHAVKVGTRYCLRHVGVTATALPVRVRDLNRTFVF